MNRPRGLVRKLQRRMELLPRLLMLMTAVPFALLANSWQVNMTLKIENDGSALRQISAEASPYFKSSRSDEGLPKSVNDVQAGGRWDGEWRTDTPTSFRYSRDMRLTALDGPAEEMQLTIIDVFSNPLSLYTTYTWREEVNYIYHAQTDPAAAEAADKALVYQVRMPGRVTEASGGSSVETEGKTAIFKLNAEQANHSLTVTAQRFRWGYLLLVLYVLAFIAYKIFEAVSHTLRLRPRKI